MKMVLLILSLSISNSIFSQDEPVDQMAEHLESMAEKSEELLEDDSWLQQMQFFRKHPMNLNIASEDQLIQLAILTPLQIKNLTQYRSLLGDLIHLNELQAVPGWDPDVIRKLL